MLHSRVALVSTIAVCLSMTAGFAQAKDCCAEDSDCKPSAKQSKAKKKPGNAAMYKITVTQSGGIAGIHKTMTVDSASLKKPEQKRLSDLLAATGIWKIDSINQTTPGAADMFFYEFEVSCCGKTHKATFDDGTLPQSYRALYDHLKTISK